MPVYHRFSPSPNIKILLQKIFMASGKTGIPHGRLDHKHTKRNLPRAEG
jgi:hypothetical protein